MRSNVVPIPVKDFSEQFVATRQMAIDAYVHWRSQGPEKHDMTAHTLAAGLLESMKGAPESEKEELLAFVLSELFETIE
ncbi:hypothetical protein [Pigmentiphaga litoralis]|uniref:hypothetical protein n=1 Tax=Pigmentiphaga litoralis TaxID=516702 RepID=UPI003B438942